MNKKYYLIAFSVIALSGCTSISVDSLKNAESKPNLCFENNPKVYEEFLPQVETMIEDQGYRMEVYPQNNKPPSDCDLLVNYTALRSWDITLNLAYAEFKVYDLQGNRVAYGEFDYGGIFDFTKWRSLETKLTPVINDLFPKRL